MKEELIASFLETADMMDLEERELALAIIIKVGMAHWMHRQNNKDAMYDIDNVENSLNVRLILRNWSRLTTVMRQMCMIFGIVPNSEI